MDNRDHQGRVEALLPLLRASLGAVEACEMTDATGFYLDGVLFGLLSGGVLHFRVDHCNRAEYDAWEREQARDDGLFGGVVGAGIATQATRSLKFRAVPPFVLDDEDLVARWGRKAFEAARRAREAANPRFR